MASTSAVLLLLFADLFTIIAGLAGFRYVASEDNRVFSIAEDQLGKSDETSEMGSFVVIGSVIGGLVILVLIILFIVCCCCCSCCCCTCCRREQVTTVTNTNVIQQQSAVQGIQYPQYQPVPTQPGYGQPMQMAPYQGQPCAPGPPPSYHVAANPGYPTSQSAYDKGQAMYPMQPPVQPGPAYTPSETLTTVYTPANMQPPNTGY